MGFRACLTASPWRPKLLVVAVVGVLLAAGSGARASQTNASSDPWSSLTVKSAWVNVGLWHPARQEWVTNPQYTIVGDEATGTEVRLPRVGDRLRISYRANLMIVDFRSRGEMMYRGSIANRAFDWNDFVAHLLEGAVVDVQEVSIGNVLELHSINVRVRPATSDVEVASPPGA